MTPLHLDPKIWTEKYGTHARVVEWLKNNPPPADWEGTREEYAYLEMPFAPGTVVGNVMFGRDK